MAKRITLTIPDELYRRAESLAEVSNRPVAKILVEAIVLEPASSLTTNGGTREVEAQLAIAREEAAFFRLHPMLWQKYPGHYVAIYGGELVDHDADQVDLYLRVKARYPGEFVWIAPVRPEPEELYIFRSPRFDGIA